MSFRNESAKFTFIRSYAKWVEELKRRETLEESVDRYIDFLVKERGDLIPAKVVNKIKHYLLVLEVMPSMRALWTAGDAARKDNTCMYNCSFQAIDSPESFNEAIYILMCGAGYGFSVQDKFINGSSKLLAVPLFTGES